MEQGSHWKSTLNMEKNIKQQFTALYCLQVTTQFMNENMFYFK